MRMTRYPSALLTTVGLLFGLLGAPLDVSAQGSGGTYYPPPESQGGWRTLVERNVEPTPADKVEIQSLAGLDWDRLEDAYQFMRRQYSGQDALLVVRHGYVAAEWGLDNSFHIASCTKSLTSLALAKLFDLSAQGQLPQTIGPDDFAYQYLPASWGLEDPARQLIKIKHLMSMSSGLEPHDSPTTTSGYLGTVLTRPAEAPPETDWAYSSAAVDLLSIIIQDLSGLGLKDFFNTHIGVEIGASASSWGSMGSYNTGSAYASMSARDLSRVAYLALNRGQWDSGSGPTAVIPESRIDVQTQWATHLAGTSFRVPNFFTNDPESHLRYGYLFWTNQTDRESFVGTGVPTDAFYMTGHFTQFVVVIPSLDMIVVRLGNGPAPWIDALMAGVMTRIIDAVQDSNEPPVALDDAETTIEERSITVDVLSNDFDPDGWLDPMTVTVVTPAANGTSAVDPDGAITYSPDSNHHGADSLVYQVCDDGGACATASVLVTLDPVNDPPVAHEQSVEVTTNTPRTIVLTGSDVDGDPLGFTMLSQPSQGTLSGTAPDLIYTPALDYGGPDSFTFEASDGTVPSNVATVSLSVSAEAPPLFSDDFSRADDGTVGNDWMETEATGTSVEIRSDRLVFVSTGDQPRRPIVQHSFMRAVSGLLTWSFLFDWSQIGPDDRYEVMMQLGDSTLLSNRNSSAGVGVNLIWTQLGGVDETLGYRHGTTQTALTQISGPTSITVTVDLDQSSYDVLADGALAGGQIPLDRASELDSIRIFTQRLDHSQHQGRAFDDMVIRAGSPSTNEPPVALGDAHTTVEDQSVTVDVLVNDFDPDGWLDPMTVTVVTPAANGQSAVDTDGAITYSPDPDHHGVDSLVYQVCDDGGACATAVVSFTIDPVNDAPAADDQDLAVTTGTPRALTLTGSDADGDALSFTVLSQPSQGILSGTAPDLVYTPAPGYEGPDSFTFETSDGSAASPVAIVSVTVSATAPALFSDGFNRADDGSIGNGWLETEVSGTSVEISGNRLVFSSTGDQSKRPIVQHSFPRAVSGTLTWSFEFDWSQTGPDANYEVLMQLGDSALLSNRSHTAGVGVNLVWAQLAGVDQTLAYRYGSNRSALTQISGPTSITVAVDLDQSLYDVLVDGVLMGSQIPLDRASELDTLRLLTHRLDHSRHLGRAFDDMVIQEGLGPTP